MNPFIEKFQEQTGEALESSSRSDQFYFTIAPEALRALLVSLRDEYGFTHLSFMTAVDQIEDGQFVLLYMLHHHGEHLDLGVQVSISRSSATMESMHDLWAQVATYQRELHEMFGITFPGSPGLTDDFILEGWAGSPPMRRDFDSYEFAEETFPSRPGRTSHDPVAYKKEQLAAQLAEQAPAPAAAKPDDGGGAE